MSSPIPPPPQPRRRVTFLAVLAATIAVLGATEVATRIFLPVRLFDIENDTIRISANPVLMYRLNPDFAQHNSQGFRDVVEYVPAKTDGVTRIAAVGDSATYGMLSDAAAAFPRQLGPILNRRQKAAGSPQRFEVLNFGVPGYSIIQEAELVRTRIDGFAPDIVVLAVSLNDWEVYTSPEFDRLVENSASSDVLADFLDPANGILHQLLFNSHLYRRLLLLTQHDPDVWKDRNPIRRFYARQHNWYGRRFGRLQNSVRTHRVQSLVALLPMQGARWDALYDMRLGELGRYCATSGCRLIDIRAAIAGAGAGKRHSGNVASETFAPDGIRFTRDGNRAIATAIADQIQLR